MRRKILLVLAITLYFLDSAKAQIEKGSILVGGNIGFMTSKTPGIKQETFTIAPSFGIAVKNNLIVGTNLRYGFQDSEFTSFDYKNYGAGIFVRKYKSLGKGFYLFAHGDLGFDYVYNEQLVQINQNYETETRKMHTFV